MSKNVLIISTSLRAHSNSDALASEFASGAVEAGHNVELTSLRGKELAYCVGCLGCQTRKDGHCFMHDDADALATKIGAADVVVFATPVYYYGMSAQMKTVLDRANPLLCMDYAFRDVYLLAAAAKEGADTFERTRQGLMGWIDCFKNSRLAGTVFAGGLTGPGEAHQDITSLEAAYNMGKGI